MKVFKKNDIMFEKFMKCRFILLMIMYLNQMKN